MGFYYVCGIPYSDELYHFGILGQKWGIRRFQNPDGTLTPEGIERYRTKSEQRKFAKDLSVIAKDNKQWPSPRKIREMPQMAHILTKLKKESDDVDAAKKAFNKAADEYWAIKDAGYEPTQAMRDNVDRLGGLFVSSYANLFKQAKNYVNVFLGEYGNKSLDGVSSRLTASDIAAIALFDESEYVDYLALKERYNL